MVKESETQSKAKLYLEAALTRTESLRIKALFSRATLFFFFGSRCPGAEPSSAGPLAQCAPNSLFSAGIEFSFHSGSRDVPNNTG